MGTETCEIINERDKSEYGSVTHKKTVVPLNHTYLNAVKVRLYSSRPVKKRNKRYRKLTYEKNENTK